MTDKLGLIGLLIEYDTEADSWRTALSAALVFYMRVFGLSPDVVFVSNKTKIQGQPGWLEIRQTAALRDGQVWIEIPIGEAYPF